MKEKKIKEKSIIFMGKIETKKENKRKENKSLKYEKAQKLFKPKYLSRYHAGWHNGVSYGICICVFGLSGKDRGA